LLHIEGLHISVTFVELHSAIPLPLYCITLYLFNKHVFRSC